MGGACFAGKPRWIRKLYFGLLGSLPTAPLGKGLRIMLAHIGHPAPQTPPPGVSAMGTRAWHGAALALGVACAAACAAVAAAGVRWWAVALLCVYVQAGSRTGHWALPPPPRAQIAPGGRHAHPNSGRPAVWRRARALRQDQKMLGCLPQTPLGCARWPCQTDSLTHSVP